VKVESALDVRGESSANNGSMTERRDVIAGRRKSGELRSDNSWKCTKSQNFSFKRVGYVGLCVRG
jgi:hypothetical protein